MAGVKRALISVSDKTGIVEMAKGLAGSAPKFYRPAVRRRRCGRPA